MHAADNPNPTGPAPIRLGVLVSGGGTTLSNFCTHIDQGALHAEVPVVIASNAASQRKVTDRHPQLNVQLAERKRYNTPAEFSDVVFDLLRGAAVDLVCLAGFLCLLRIPDDFAHRVMNIHPALLPAFGGQGMHGSHVHQAVIEHGCKVSGCTVHFADQTYDTGPIIVQRTCAVEEDDTPLTLAARVFEQECIAYPQAIELFRQRRIELVGRRARILPAQHA